MRCFLVFSFLSILLSGNLLAQEPEDLSSLMTETLPNCEDVELNSLRLIPYYFQVGEIDSAYMVLNYFDHYCNKNGMSAITRYLLNLHQGKSSPFPAHYLPTYHQPIGNSTHYFPGQQIYDTRKHYRFYTHYLPEAPRKEFQSFLKSLAASIQLPETATSLEKLVVYDFANGTNALFEKIHSEGLPNTKVQDLRDSLYHQGLNDVMFRGYFLGGAWMPIEGMEEIGAKANLGLTGGVSYQRFFAQLNLRVRAGRARFPYQVFDQDSLFTTREHIGGLIGLDMGAHLIKTYKQELNFMGGIGYDGIDAVSFEEHEPFETVSIGSLNLNAGLEFLHYYKPEEFFGIQARIHNLNYNTHGGTLLKGQAISIGLIWGGTGSSSRRIYQESFKGFYY